MELFNSAGHSLTTTRITLAMRLSAAFATASIFLSSVLAGGAKRGSCGDEFLFTLIPSEEELDVTATSSKGHL